MDQIPSFGYWVRRQRKALDLTQLALSRRVGCARVTISKIERDERRPSRLMAERLADALCISQSERQLFIEVALAERSADGLALPTKLQSFSSPEYKPGFIYNVPAPPTALVGRKQEIADISKLLKSRRVRLLTLLGSGGVGKTRLAIQTAARLGRYYQNGVTFVPLGSIRNPELVATKIAETLGIIETRERSLVEGVIYYLQNRQMLLLIDNFEHVLSEATLISQLLAAAPNLTILATSRAPLHISGEYEFPVPPLQLPELVYDPRQLLPVGEELLPELESSESFQLFVDRAGARRMDFEVNCETAPYIAEICRSLDGLPLAIELAAAKIKTESPQTLLTRMEDRFDLLANGPRDLPPRMQTLHNTFDWSYELLDEQEKRFFNRLGVFSGGCSQEAALAVCCREPLEWDQSQLIKGLTSLVDQCMLQRMEDPNGELRVGMLATLQEYAIEQLAERNEEDETRRLHLEFFADLAEAAKPHIWDEEQETWGIRLETELDNLRSAMSWALQRSAVQKDEIELGARLAGALWYFWYGRGYLPEGRRWLAVALDRAIWPTKARAKVVTAAAALAWQQGDNSQARILADEAIDLWRHLEDLQGLGEILHMMGHIVFDQQDYEAARHLIQESLDVYESGGDATMRIWLISDLGMVAYHQGNYQDARERYEESLALFQELGCKDGLASTFLRLGDLARLADDYERASNFYQRGRELFEELDLKLEIASAYHKLGYIYQHRGDFLQAKRQFVQALEMQVEMGNKQGIIECLAGLAGLAAANSQLVLSARLFGAAQGLLDETGLPVAPADQVEWDRYEALAREGLGQAEYERIWQQGFSMPHQQAVDLGRSRVKV